MTRPRILVVGSMNMDLNVYGVPKIPEFGESVVCSTYSYATGGKGANQAYAASLQGSIVTMAGRVGDDLNGYKLTDNLKKAGINTDYIVIDQHAQTGLATIMVDETGKYVSHVILGANNNLDDQDVETAIDSDQFDMVLMQLEMPLETVYRTYELARKKKTPVFLDAGPAMDIPLDRLQGLFIISPNESETKALTGISVDSEFDCLEAAKQLYERAQPQYVLLKLGSRGSYLYDGNKATVFPAFEVNAVDSTGAGDTFNAAFITRFCKGDLIEEAISFASAAASICVSRLGAQPSIPNENEVHSFLNHAVKGL